MNAHSAAGFSKDYFWKFDNGTGRFAGRSFAILRNKTCDIFRDTCHDFLMDYDHFIEAIANGSQVIL